MNTPPSWTVSLISHAHGRTILGVLNDLHAQLSGRDYRIVVTRNLAEEWDLLATLPAAYRAHTELRTNQAPLGFGANHNAALADARSDYVLMVDPDLRLTEPVFAALDSALAQPECRVASPRAVTPEGELEDNGRPLFTPMRLVRRYVLGRQHDTRRLTRCDRPQVDWLAGLFLAMRRADFHALGGFDSGYFMYAEDIDLCLRAQLQGGHCALLEQVQIMHPARRATLRNGRHLMWHLRSLLRLWRSQAYRDFRQLSKSR